ncbi:hypothetical protein ASE73_05990 [Sphingomonas sp. Leaf24]|uniref:hypothetical protein n=1 Tax=unclassified Sphingomonas TaxID=196159 RepID=UPI0006FCBDB2|nr:MULTISPECIES: hypothetical protein [unclassified Sphingomonas]KQM21217.1 hypothetical protein ASE50_14725 [Sphingomonas sp. Leaf5]KQM89765.1 hypothetical protein ASE73_05990 [Sphingomonas sp. Leaf24]
MGRSISIGYRLPRRRLFRLASVARRFVAPVWPAWHADWGVPSPLSRYTCVRSGLFVVRLLAEQGIVGVLRSGVPLADEREPASASFGFRAAGEWESHAWVEAGGFVIDITADQFGDAPVIVLPVHDRRYAAGEGPTALPAPGPRSVKAVDIVWQAWTCRTGREHFASLSPATDS